MRRALPFVALVFAAACRQLVGIDHVELGEGGAPPMEGGMGTPTQVFTRGNEPISKILSDGQYVYALLAASIVRCKVSGCGTTPDPVVPMVSGGIIDDMAVGGRLYYSMEGTVLALADGGSPPANDGSIHVVDKDGKNDQVFLPKLPAPTHMALATDLYWFDDQTIIAADNPINTLRRCPIAGGCGQGVSVIDGLGGFSTAVAADTKSVYVLTGNKMGTNDGVYACGAGATCGMMPRLAIGSVDTTAISSIASDGTYLYFTSDTKGDILRVDQTNMVKTLVGGQVGPVGIATDGKFVYWGTSTGAVMRVGIDGGTAQVVASSQAKPNLVTTDAANVYWVVESGAGSAVMTLPKPP